MDKLEGNEFEATLLKASDDGADEAALDAVGLQGVLRVSTRNAPSRADDAP